MTTENEICTVIIGQVMKAFETMNDEVREIENDSHDRNLAMAWVNDFITQWQMALDIGNAFFDPLSSTSRIFGQVMKSISMSMDNVATRISTWK